MNKSLISLALLLTLAACDDDYESYTQNTPATFSGEQSAGVANDATSDVTGTLTVRDPDDGEDMATPQPATTTTYGAFTLAANGAWVYTLDTNNSAVSALASSSDMLTDTISVASVDGTTSNITITIVGVDAATPAIIGGELTKTMANDTASTTGTVTVTDPDEGEAVIVSQSSMATMYGTFSIADAGDWTYTLDTTNSEVMALATPSDRLTDTIAIESADGTTSAVVITITGPAPSNQTLSKVAKISDLDSGDSGELRYAFSSTLATGKITARFNKDIVVTDDVNATPKEAYIALWGSSTSTNNALVDLRIGNGTFTIRNKSDITITETFNTGEWVDVEMTWDATNASSTVAPLVTVTINGASLTTTAFSSTSSSLADVAAGVQKLVLKLSDNGSIVTGDVYFDDIFVYNDVAGNSLFWDEDFEGFDVDYDLALTYTDSATNEAIVVEKLKGGDAPAPTTSKTAKISDTDSGDSGELRYAFANTLTTGKITARFNKDTVVTDDVNATPKEAYIALWGGSTSTNNALVDLRIGNGTFTIRNKSDITITETFTPGEWVNVEMTWDATNASSTVAPLVTVTINGTSLTTTAFSSTSSSLADVAAGVQKLVLKLSDNGSIVTGDVYFDDINVYSDVAGLVPFWNENFEGFDADYDLALTYTDSATNEAIVAVK